MRRPLVAGNWKMNLTSREGAAHIQAFLRYAEMKHMVDVVICPSFLTIPAARSVLANSRVCLGAQDVFWEEKGAFTGNVSVNMLAEFGVSFCIVGHSETRGRFGKLEAPEDAVVYFAETDRTISLKIGALLNHGIAPILCVGETDSERETGQTSAVIQAQLAGALEGYEDAELTSLVVAYEPVWAIGTGKTCDSAEANNICGMIRSWLSDCYSPEFAQSIRILYGGSVKSSNSDELFDQPEIDGGLVGGASLDPKEFSKIVLSA